MKQLKFWLHYNKPASQKAGRPQFTVHYRGVCHIVDRVLTHVSMETQIRPTQPRAVLAGYCDPSQFEVIDDGAFREVIVGPRG